MPVSAPLDEPWRKTSEWNGKVNNVYGHKQIASLPHRILSNIITEKRNNVYIKLVISYKTRKLDFKFVKIWYHPQ